ncbi:hypothetical protein SteCoe_29959 [Stentor coeruleus]|uniref:Uncharacterized protein n=1 Tax=Stentor coeruleus TaxID=5963 RepID=A0A1R2B4M1_9CILI|nr:hypothetical protein SteCoe_29959 [Stentor coeruleus]
MDLRYSIKLFPKRSQLKLFTILQENNHNIIVPLFFDINFSITSSELTPDGYVIDFTTLKIFWKDIIRELNGKILIEKFGKNYCCEERRDNFRINFPDFSYFEIEKKYVIVADCFRSPLKFVVDLLDERISKSLDVGNEFEINCVRKFEVIERKFDEN